MGVITTKLDAEWTEMARHLIDDGTAERYIPKKEKDND